MSSRLSSQIMQLSLFFFGGAPEQFTSSVKTQPDFVNEFLAISAGLALIRAYAWGGKDDIVARDRLIA